MVHHEVSAALLFRDSFSGLTIPPEQLRYRLDKVPTKPICKQGSFAVFLNLMPGQRQLEVESPRYATAVLTLHVDLGSPSGEVVTLELHPSRGYPQREGSVTASGSIPGSKEVCLIACRKNLWLRARAFDPTGGVLTMDSLNPVWREIGFYNPEKQEFSVVKLLSQIDSERYLVEGELTKTELEQSLPCRIYRGEHQKDGSYFILAKKEECSYLLRSVTERTTSFTPLAPDGFGRLQRKESG